MSLVFACVAPHSPILLPSVGREHLQRVKKTIDGLARLEEELAAAKPDAILTISPHGPVETEHFTLDLNEAYACDLREFGVLESGLNCRPDMRIANDIREHLEDRGLPLMLRSGETLDYGTIVPLTYLAKKFEKISLVPLFPSLLDAKTHFEFGRALQEVILKSDRRVAVIASADLSHRLTENAPGGFSAVAKDFDEKVIELITNKNSAGFLTFDQVLLKEAGECGFSTLTAFMGLLDRIHGEPEILSYEGPFGIGHLVMRYVLA